MTLVAPDSCPSIGSSVREQATAALVLAFLAVPALRGRRGRRGGGGGGPLGELVPWRFLERAAGAGERERGPCWNDARRGGLEPFPRLRGGGMPMPGSSSMVVGKSGKPPGWSAAWQFWQRSVELVAIEKKFEKLKRTREHHEVSWGHTDVHQLGFRADGAEEVDGYVGRTR